MIPNSVSFKKILENLLHWSHQNHQRPDRILPNFHMCVCVSQAWHLPFLLCIKMMDWWWCFGVWGISVGCIHQNRQSIIFWDIFCHSKQIFKSPFKSSSSSSTQQPANPPTNLQNSDKIWQNGAKLTRRAEAHVRQVISILHFLPLFSQITLNKI